MYELPTFGPTGWLLVTAALAVVPLLFTLRRLRSRFPEAATTFQEPEQLQSSALATELAKRLPASVFFRHRPQFRSSLGSYWSKQQREITPECIVIPLKEEEISTAVEIIKEEFDCRIAGNKAPPAFAIRSGGHSTIPGASNTALGVVIDLSHFNQVQVAEDRGSVLVGPGARWGDVSRKLDKIGLAVSGGRNSDVGVGGLTLGGGYSYFSPQSGFVCDNVLEYRVVLASGAITVASEHENASLWRALKGGGNNFGIVTSLKLRAFPCAKVWSGFLYMFSWKAPQVLSTFHHSIRGSFDSAAGGPLVCISYVQQIGIQIISTHLMYTKPQAWPACWEGFKRIGRIWSSTKVRTLTSTTDELDGISPAGFRQLHTSTTVKNELSTLQFAHATYERYVPRLKKIKGMVWTLVLQPLHTSTMRHGKHNVLGLHGRTDNLVVILFTAVWERESDDALVKGSGRAAIREINTFAEDRGTADNFRYLNWCDGTQQPFQSYGEENLSFLRETSKHVDPYGLFQKGCVGGHKLFPLK